MKLFFNLKSTASIVNIEACRSKGCECFTRLCKTYNERSIPKKEYKDYKRCFEAQRFRPSHDYFFIP